MKIKLYKFEARKTFYCKDITKAVIRDQPTQTGSLKETVLKNMFTNGKRKVKEKNLHLSEKTVKIR